MSKYSKLPQTPIKEIAFNAATILTEFAPETPTIDRSKILLATTGGSTFNSNIKMRNLFEGIDNAKTNTKQGAYIDSYDPHLTTTGYSIGNNIKKLMPNASVTTTAATTTTASLTKVEPNQGFIPASDYFDLWIVTDYALAVDADGNTTNGFFAIHMMNCIEVNGFQQQTTNEDKTQYMCDFQAHYDNEDDETPPFEIYFSDGAVLPSGV